MERLTERRGKNALIRDANIIARGDCNKLNDALVRLAAYEDTDLMPEQVTALRADNERMKRLVCQGCTRENCDECDGVSMWASRSDRDNERLKRELAGANMCDGCPRLHTVGCHCAKAYQRGLAGREGTE